LRYRRGRTEVLTGLSRYSRYQKGTEGLYAFYRASFDVPSENFYDANGSKVIEILSSGRQTVIPPSTHPDTKQPYEWTNGHSLYDTPSSGLASWPSDYRERMLSLGYVSGKSRPKTDEKFDPETGQIQNGFGDSPCIELNAVAIKNLSAWVQELGLYNLKRKPGRGASYRVATWRESHQGRPDEQRERNLSIHPQGIEDFGDGRKYIPLDLVVAARSSSLAEAFCWLEEKLLPKKPDIEIDFDKIIEAQDAPSIAPEREPEPQESDLDMSEAELAMLGSVWEFGDPIPPEEPMLVPVFVPARPLLGYLGGQRSTFKTFVTNDLAVAIASGGEFAGQKVAYPGLVVQVELEGSLSKVRVTVAAGHRGIKERLPILHLTKIPPPVLIAKRLNPEWKKWAEVCVRVAERRAKKLGLPLALITMDPVMYFAGVDDNNSWSQWTDVCKALILLAQAAGCPVLVVDHYGKDEERGLIGSAAKEAAAHFVLGSGGDRESRTDRQLEVKKMKDGPAYICVDFDLDTYDVTLSKRDVQEDGAEVVERQTHTTLVIKWGQEVRPIDAALKGGGDGERLSDLQRTALIKLITLINTEGAEIPPGLGAPVGMRGIHIERWFERLSRGRALGERGQSEANFKKLLMALQAKHQIEVHEPWVWVPLAANSGGPET
jgi:hypothetical protein